MNAIDLTDRFHKTEFMRGGPAAWAIDRSIYPFRNIIIHHTTSAMSASGVPMAYGIRTDGKPTAQAQEEAALLSLARDHYNRFGIGPGYTGAVFQSGRGYWVGKAGTTRRHTTNTNGRTDGHTWNFDSVAIVLFGNMDFAPITPAMQETVLDMVGEVLTWRITRSPVSIMGHGDTWNTGCPGTGGKKLVEYIKRMVDEPPVAVPTEHPALKHVRSAEVELAEARRLLEGGR